MQGGFFKSGKLWAGVVLVLFITAFINTAWVAEDAFITFREVANFANGYGITWNPGERVQAFTHPLWFFLLTPFFLLKLDPFFSVIGLSFVLFLLTVILLLRMAELPRVLRVGSFSAFALLLCSRGFVDYSSSGLENPLNHFLLAVYLVFHVFGNESKSRLHWHVLFAVLLWLTRPDAFVPVFPLLVWSFVTAWRTHQLRDWRWIAALMPGILWLAFSTFYFGSPIPNTALAKVATSLSVATKFHMAAEYFVWHFHNDIASLILIAAGIVLGACARDIRLRLLAAGLVLWIVYLFAIGADYMQGRFLSAVVFMAACVIVFAARNLSRANGLFLCLLAVAATPALAKTVGSSADYYNPKIPSNGIADERGFYYPWLGLMSVVNIDGNWKTHPWYFAGLRASRLPGEYVRCNLGMFGYGTGAGVAIIDPYALTDSFIARLPSRKNVRPGHYEREVPYEYLESRASGENRMTDSYWHMVYDDVALVSRGNLFDIHRLAAIIRLNSGDLFGRPAFTEPQMSAAAIPDSLCTPVVNGGSMSGMVTFRLVMQQGHLLLKSVH